MSDSFEALLLDPRVPRVRHLNQNEHDSDFPFRVGSKPKTLEESRHSLGPESESQNRRNLSVD